MKKQRLRNDVNNPRPPQFFRNTKYEAPPPPLHIRCSPPSRHLPPPPPHGGPPLNNHHFHHAPPPPPLLTLRNSPPSRTLVVPPPPPPLGRSPLYNLLPPPPPTQVNNHNRNFLSPPPPRRNYFTTCNAPQMQGCPVNRDPRQNLQKFGHKPPPPKFSPNVEKTIKKPEKVYHSPYRRCLRRPKFAGKEKNNQLVLSKNSQQKSLSINDNANTNMGNPQSQEQPPDITAQSLNDLLFLCNSNAISALSANTTTPALKESQNKVLSSKGAVEINSGNCALPAANLNTDQTERHNKSRTFLTTADTTPISTEKPPTRPKKRRKYC